MLKQKQSILDVKVKILMLLKQENLSGRVKFVEVCTDKFDGFGYFVLGNYAHYKMFLSNI